jgi:hypothetical protein
MDIKFAHWGTENLVISEELRNNPKLTSISAIILRRDDGLNDNSVTQDLTSLLTSSPNLRSLKLELEADKPPGIAGQHPGPRQVLPFTELDPVMSFKSLSIGYYNFEDTGPTGLLYHINASALQHLRISYCHSCPRLFDHLSKQPLRLKSVNIDKLYPVWDPNRPCFASFEKFLLSFSGLESLAISKSGYGELLYTFDGLLHHASSLKYLKLDITDYRGTQTQINDLLSISNEQLRDIVGKCIVLEELYIYLDRKDLEEVDFHSHVMEW